VGGWSRSSRPSPERPRPPDVAAPVVRRAFVRPDAVEAGRLRFDAAEAHHLGRVLRVRPGAIVEATDGEGRLYVVRLETLDRDGAWAAIEACLEPGGESPCAITLAPALLKGDRMDWLVQKATELGVVRILPVETARIVVRRMADDGPRRVARWSRIAREAMKQCGRVVVPRVEAPRRLADVVAEAPGHDRTWLCWEGGGLPLARAAEVTGPVARLLLLVGPEGGFTGEEAGLAQSAGATLVSLGPRILRAESAAIAALAVCQYLFGDLGMGGSPSPEGPMHSSGDDDVANAQREVRRRC
jgi:16S rRNA (uracil1498-N3)-methyltransferase